MIRLVVLKFIHLKYHQRPGRAEASNRAELRQKAREMLAERLICVYDFLMEKRIFLTSFAHVPY